MESREEYEDRVALEWLDLMKEEGLTNEEIIKIILKKLSNKEKYSSEMGNKDEGGLKIRHNPSHKKGEKK